GGLRGNRLADDGWVERRAAIRRFGPADVSRLAARTFIERLVEDAFAGVDATVANIDAGTGNQLAHLGVAFATKRAHGEIGSAGHIRRLKGAAFIPRPCGMKRPPRPPTGAWPHRAISGPCEI